MEGESGKQVNNVIGEEVKSAIALLASSGSTIVGGLRKVITYGLRARNDQKLVLAMNQMLNHSLPGTSTVWNPVTKGFPLNLVPKMQLTDEELEDVVLSHLVSSQGLLESYPVRTDQLITPERTVQILQEFYLANSFGNGETFDLYGEQKSQEPVHNPEWLVRPGLARFMDNNEDSIQKDQALSEARREELQFRGKVKIVGVIFTLDGEPALVWRLDGQNRFTRYSQLPFMWRDYDERCVFASARDYKYTGIEIVDLALMTMFVIQTDIYLAATSTYREQVRIATLLYKREVARCVSIRSQVRASLETQAWSELSDMEKFRALVGSDGKASADVTRNAAFTRPTCIATDHNAPEMVDGESAFRLCREARLGAVAILLQKLVKSLEEAERTKKYEGNKFGVQRCETNVLNECQAELVLASSLKMRRDLMSSGLERVLSRKKTSVSSDNMVSMLYSPLARTLLVAVTDMKDLAIDGGTMQSFQSVPTVSPVLRNLAIMSQVSMSLEEEQKRAIRKSIKGSLFGVMEALVVHEKALVNAAVKGGLSVSDMKSNVSVWVNSRPERAFLVREILEYFMERGFHNSGAADKASSYYMAVKAMSTKLWAPDRKITLDSSVPLDGTDGMYVHSGKSTSMDQDIYLVSYANQKMFRVHVTSGTVAVHITSPNKSGRNKASSADKHKIVCGSMKDFEMKVIPKPRYSYDTNTYSGTMSIEIAFKGIEVN